MHNLKHFVFYPCCSHGEPLVPLQHSCVFQLESFDIDIAQSELYRDFFRQQRVLRHLSFMQLDALDDPEALRSMIPPHLMSLECSFPDFVAIAAVTRIVAWEDSETTAYFGLNHGTTIRGHSPADALQRLEYMKLSVKSGFREVLDYVTLRNLVLLELIDWNLDVGPISYNRCIVH